MSPGAADFAAPASVAREVADDLAEVSPRAAAIVYSDLLGIATDSSPDEVREAFRALAFRYSALLDQVAAANAQGRA